MTSVRYGKTKRTRKKEVTGYILSCRWTIDTLQESSKFLRCKGYDKDQRTEIVDTDERIVLALEILNSKSHVWHWCEYKSVICRRYRLGWSRKFLTGSKRRGGGV